jgi:hypothetical protein
LTGDLGFPGFGDALLFWGMMSPWDIVANERETVAAFRFI